MRVARFPFIKTNPFYTTSGLQPVYLPVYLHANNLYIDAFKLSRRHPPCLLLLYILPKGQVVEWGEADKKRRNPRLRVEMGIPFIGYNDRSITQWSADHILTWSADPWPKCLRGDICSIYRRFNEQFCLPAAPRGMRSRCVIGYRNKQEFIAKMNDV